MRKAKIVSIHSEISKKMLTKKNLLDLIQDLKPNSIDDKFFYDSVSQKAVERSNLVYPDYKETYYDSSIQNTDDFNLNFFPIEFFFSDTQKLKQICDEYKISFEIHIDTTGDLDLNLTSIDENLYSIRYNSKPITDQCCLISILDIKKISDEGILCTILNDINKLILKEIKREISFYGWRSKKVSDILQYSSMMVKFSNHETNREMNHENTIISLEDCQVTLPKEICKKDKILYNLEGFKYPSLYFFQIDISDMRNRDDEIVLCERCESSIQSIQSDSSDRKSGREEIRFIVTYTLPYLDPYLSIDVRRPKFRYCLLDNKYLIKQEIIYEVTPQHLIM